MTEICNIEDCTGCQACRMVCPVSAISFVEDKRGHIYPSIDQSLCIDCSKCVRTCPSIHPVIHNEPPAHAIACWTKNKLDRQTSTSGAISYTLSKRFVERGGYFFGVTWDQQQNNAVHDHTKDPKELWRFQGSKYSHSDVRNTYQTVESFLKKGEKVLFSGTPCQIAGLKAYLKNDYPGLYTIGLVCHGVPSRKALRERIQGIEAELGVKVVDYRSRVKTPDQYFTSSQYVFDNGERVSVSIHQDYFFRFFVTNYGLRPNCFNCSYSNSQRVEDLTVGDFWQYRPKSLKYRSYRKGTSEVLVNNSKGQELFDSIRDLLVIDVRPLSQAQAGNRNLLKPQPIPDRYEEFWHEYENGASLEELSPRYYPLTQFNIPVKTRIKVWLNMLLPTTLLKHL